MLLKKKPPLLFTLGTALGLTAGGATAYWLLSSRVHTSLPAGIQLVPQDALIALTVTTQESDWTQLRQFGTPETQQAFDQLLLQWRDRLLVANGYSFKQDIAPWVGDEATIVVLPADAAPETPQGEDSPDPAESPPAETPTQAVMILPIADPVKAQALMSAPREAEVSWVGRDYKGVTVQSVKTATGDPLETAVLGTDWLVVGNSPDGVERVIDSHKGAASVLETPGYRAAMQSLKQPQAFARAYINLPAATETVGTTNPVSAAQGLAATLSLTDEGVRFQGVSWLDPKSEQTYAELDNSAGEMPRRLPQDTLLMVSGGSLQQLWQSLEGTGAPLLPFDPVSLKAGLESLTGLSLEADFLPWMDGEFAFGLLPPRLETTDPAAPEAPASTVTAGQLVMLVQTNDRAAAEATWEKLDTVVASRYRYGVEETLVDGLPVTEWVSPFQGISMSHGWLDGNVTFLGVGVQVPRAIAPRPTQSLAESGRFQALTRAAPRENNGHFFIDLQQLNSLEGSLPIPQLAPGNASITTAIRALGVTAAVRDDRSIYYDIAVELAKGDRPGALQTPEP